MRTIRLTETTLSANPKMAFKEKLETAQLLDALCVGALETCPVGADKADEILVKTIAASAFNSVISCPVRLGDDPVKAWEAVKNARKPRLNVKIPVSVVQMEYLGHKKPAAMLDVITQAVSAAKALSADVEFTALDAARAEDEFLMKALSRAVQAGANAVTLCDDAGEMLPGEFGAFVKNLLVNVPELADVSVGVCCSDALSMATACAFEAVRAGANAVCVRASGDGIPSLEAMTAVLNARGESCGAAACVDATAIQRATKRIRAFLSAQEMETLNGAEAASPAMPKQELDKSADIHEVARASRLLGYELSSEDLARVFEAFSQLAAKKPVSSRELDAIIASVALQVPPTYTLSSYVVNSGNIISATAHVVLDKDGETVQGLSTGDGPIDAALMAIEKIIGHHYELDDFQIQSVTGGREAMGEALVKLRDGGRLYSGRGISTDVIGASIRAYLNALNKIVYRE